MLIETLREIEKKTDPSPKKPFGRPRRRWFSS
jgi:hypothetical protein